MHFLVLNINYNFLIILKSSFHTLIFCITPNNLFYILRLIQPGIFRKILRIRPSNKLNFLVLIFFIGLVPFFNLFIKLILIPCIAVLSPCKIENLLSKQTYTVRHRMDLTIWLSKIYFTV